MSYLKNKITEERDKIEIFEQSDFGIQCTKELKNHPQDMGALINSAKKERLKCFEFAPDFEFECTRVKYLSFKQYKEWKELLKGMCAHT